MWSPVFAFSCILKFVGGDFDAISFCWSFGLWRRQSVYLPSSQTIDVGCRNENVLTEPFQPTIMEGKGSEDMSFVGIVFAEGKIIGFGDSKATILQNGIMRQDILRQNVRKVFSNGRIIIACCGANEIPVMEERKLKYIRGRRLDEGTH